MTRHRFNWIAPAALALGLASAVAARAQPVSAPIRPTDTAPEAPPVGAAADAERDGVTVQARRPAIPATRDRQGQYDAETAKEAAFRAYRASRPEIASDSKGFGDPNDLAQDYPGLSSYLPD